MQEFQIVWPEAKIADVKRRLAAASLPPVPGGDAWSAGSDVAFMERLRAYWLEEFDWQAALDNLNRFPQFTATVDGQLIHFVHVRSESRTPRPLLLTHGWPGSIFEFWDMIEPLAFPSRFGGDPDSGFDVVVPSLPGFGYSGKPASPLGPRAIARLWDRLMTEVLGYDRYLAQGGDWGGAVTSQLGVNHADHVAGIHVNMVGILSAAGPQNPAEEEWMARWQEASARYSGYHAVQMTKPLSLAWLAEGNPLGQAAWIIERFHDWADLRFGDLEKTFGLDRLLTNILLYVMPESFASSMWIYAGFARDEPLMLAEGERCQVPTGFLACPGDALNPMAPKSRIELCYNLMHWTELKRGGHFPAMEDPQGVTADVRLWADKLWAPAGSVGTP
jgi:pimeloyl-ACP methyl ester carboxylesterase